MAIIITNQATLNYRYGTATAAASSNVTSTTLNGPLEISKSSLSDTYRIGQDITFILTLTNNSNVAVEQVVVNDNLGTYHLNQIYVTPLTYIGPAHLFINGVFDSVINPTVTARQISFEIPSIPANGNVQILYLTRVNQYANGASGSEITNTSTADEDCNCPCDDLISDSHTITAEDFADVRIIKSACPNPAVCGERIYFTFTLYNYGNMDATDVVLTDTFDPVLSDIEVTVNGEIIDSENYSYENGKLTLPTSTSDYNITIPAASFEQDPTTGIVTVTPSIVQIVVSGII